MSIISTLGKELFHQYVNDYMNQFLFLQNYDQYYLQYHIFSLKRYLILSQNLIKQSIIKYYYMCKFTTTNPNKSVCLIEPNTQSFWTC